MINGRITAEDVATQIPTTVSRAQVIAALTWLGMTEDIVNELSSVVFESDSVTFEAYTTGDPEPRYVTVKAEIR